MPKYLGDFREDATIRVYFTTVDALGEPVAPSSAFEAADVKIYKNGSDAQKTATDGLTMTSPFDSLTGLHLLTIDTSNDTNDAGFWVANADYTVVLDPDETVDAASVREIIAEFSIENRSSNLLSADSFVLVAQAATDTARGTALGEALTTAKALTPSATNHVTVRVPSGRYLLTSTLDWDTAYINLEAVDVQTPAPRSYNDHDREDGTTSLDEYRPTAVQIYCSTNNVTTFEQSADNCRFRGITFAQLSGDAANDGVHAFYCSVDNDGSVYEDCCAFHLSPNYVDGELRMPWAFVKNVAGVWRRCVGNACSWRCGYHATDEVQFRATMEDIYAGAYSVIGDSRSGDTGTKHATGARLIGVKCVGQYTKAGIPYGSGFACFAGCNDFGMDIDSDCYLDDCEAGERSYALGSEFAAEAHRLIGGDYCVASTVNDTYAGDCSGKVYDSTFGAASCGGRNGSMDNGKLTGTLRNVTSLDPNGVAGSWRIEGATIDGCLLGTNFAYGITLLDSLSRITDSTILVLEGYDTSVPIHAASAKSVCASHNRYNNKAFFPTGLHANVTNIGTGPVDAHVTQISGDADAADNLEAILDGTGGTGLTINSLIINGNAAGGVVDIDNAGGPGVKVDGSTFGLDIDGATAGMQVSGGTTGIGLDIDGGSSSGVAIAVDSIDATAAIDINNASGSGISVTSTIAGMLLQGTVAGLYCSGGNYGFLLDGSTSDIRLAGTGTITTSTADVIQTSVAAALNTAVPDSPTADSINERVKAIDVLTEASGDGDLAAIKNDLPVRPTKNTALANFMFLMVASSDHVTATAGLTVTARRSIDGAAFGSCANAVVEVSNGIYKIDLAAADLNGDVITLRFTADTADDRLITIVTQP